MAQERFATITTPLGDALQLVSMRGSESLGELFAYEVELISEDPNVDETQLLGLGATIKVSLKDGKTRYFHGLVTSFGYGGTRGRYIIYHATLRPWLWLLSQASDCKIFQRMTVPDVISKVFKDHGFSDYKLTLNGDYPEREYIVQYRETTLTFVMRLLEQEGIYFYFKHEDGSHSLELVDAISAHNPAPGYEKLSFFAPGTLNEDDYIDHWSAQRHVRTGAYAITDFDFKKPKADLAAQLKQPGKYEHADKEFYDYPGGYEETKDGERYVRARTESMQEGELGFTGLGNARGISTGVTFELEKFPRDKLNCKYLVTAASYAIEGGEYESVERSNVAPFRFSIQAVDSSIPYVARRRTPKPTVGGPQTATVVGPSSEEIWTDKYGRVKIQFHWDREGKRDENSSCWVRVAQLWSGANWGGVHIPRIGHEVIVEFLEGDPDRPIITGRVYNDANMPPYTLPDSQTQSGIKSRSSPKGGVDNFNELRFEDKKGKEQVFIQAERNMDTTVKAAQSLSVGATRNKTDTGKETNKIDGGRETTIEKFDNLTVNSANKNTTVHGQFNTTADEHYKVTQKKTQLLMKDKVYVESNGDIELRNGGTHYRAQQGGKLSLKVMDEVSITCGAASITMKKDGTIEIVGTKVKVGTKTNNTAYEPIGVTVSGAKISSAAVGIHEINGAVIKVG